MVTNDHDVIRIIYTPLFLALKQRDRNTANHCERVELLSVKVGKAIGLTQNAITILGCAARLHDLGKIAMPDKILFKPSQLTYYERKIMCTHSHIGANIVESAGCKNAEMVACIIKHHHERVDGGGYPDGLSGDKIPLLSRIISVVDSYDSMTTYRLYRINITHENALEIMKNGKGTKLDAEIVDVFINVILNP